MDQHPSRRNAQLLKRSNSPLSTNLLVARHSECLWSSLARMDVLVFCQELVSEQGDVSTGQPYPRRLLLAAVLSNTTCSSDSKRTPGCRPSLRRKRSFLFAHWSDALHKGGSAWAHDDFNDLRLNQTGQQPISEHVALHLTQKKPAKKMVPNCHFCGSARRCCCCCCCCCCGKQCCWT
jgi:hypothetical protein